VRHGCNAARGVALGCHETGSGSPRQGRGTLVTDRRSRSREETRDGPIRRLPVITSEDGVGEESHGSRRPLRCGALWPRGRDQSPHARLRGCARAAIGNGPRHLRGGVPSAQCLLFCTEHDLATRLWLLGAHVGTGEDAGRGGDHVSHRQCIFSDWRVLGTSEQIWMAVCGAAANGDGIRGPRRNVVLSRHAAGAADRIRHDLFSHQRGPAGRVGNCFPRRADALLGRRFGARDNPAVGPRRSNGGTGSPCAAIGACPACCRKLGGAGAGGGETDCGARQTGGKGGYSEHLLPFAWLRIRHPLLALCALRDAPLCQRSPVLVYWLQAFAAAALEHPAPSRRRGEASSRPRGLLPPTRPPPADGIGGDSETLR
jgi:hypothetical protein